MFYIIHNLSRQAVNEWSKNLLNPLGNQIALYIKFYIKQKAGCTCLMVVKKVRSLEIPMNVPMSVHVFHRAKELKHQALHLTQRKASLE